MARNALTPLRSRNLFGSDPFLSLHREVNRLFDDVLRRTTAPSSEGQGGSQVVFAPDINVSESEKEIRVTAELPGVRENDIQVDLHDDMLIIRGEKKFEQKEEKENFYFVERSYGNFQRAIQLPFPINPAQVQATFENGVLTVTLPKSAQQERSRRIQVQSGGATQSSGSGAQSSDQLSQGAGAAGQSTSPQTTEGSASGNTSS
jgi:HSP20 family protein